MKANTQNIETPVAFVRAIEKYLGIQFRYDMAADKYNTKAPMWYTEEMDSLTAFWPDDGWCFLNPPFAQVGKWCEVCKVQSCGSKIVSIWPLSSDKNMIPAWKNANVYVIHGRVWSLVRGIMLCVWGEEFREPVKGLQWDREKETLTRIW